LKNKKVLYGVLAAVALLVIVLIALAVLLLPLLLQGVEYLTTHGLKGIVDALIALATQIWGGTGK
jgi:hypothetical protein